MRTLSLALISLGMVFCADTLHAATCSEGPFQLTIYQGRDHVEVRWNKPAGLRKTIVELEISEIRPTLTRRGTIRVRSGATGWTSTPRKALGSGYFDVKSPIQWTDAGVLTPGSEYDLRFKFISEDEVFHNRITHCATKRVALTALRNSQRPALFGDARLATIGVAVLVTGLLILPAAVLLFIASPALAEIPRALRGDIQISSALRRFAADRSIRGFVRTIFFAAACLLLIKTRLPSMLAGQIDPEDVNLLQRTLRILGRMSPRDWRLDHRSLLKELVGNGAADSGKPRRK